MTMHLVRGLSSLNVKKRKQRVTKKDKELLVLINANREEAGLPKLTTLTADKRVNKEFKPLQINNGVRRAGAMDYKRLTSKHDTEHVATVSSVMDPRNLAKETPEVRAAIIAKSQRLAPAYNKGAVQYITDGADMTDIGRKK